MSKILIKVTNGCKVHIENVSYLLQEGHNECWYKEIKVKETELENHKDHFIYMWSEDFYTSKKIPDWVLKSQTLEFEVIHE